MDRAWMRFYDKEEVDNIRYFEGSAYEMLSTTCAKMPERRALIYFHERFTYSRLLFEIDKAAEKLIEYGIKKGDVVLFSFPNSIPLIVMFYAVNKIGAIASFLDPDASRGTVKNALLSNGCKALFCNGSLRDKLKGCLDDTNVKLVVFAELGDYMKPFHKLILAMTHLSYGDMDYFRRELPQVEGVKIVSYIDMVSTGFNPETHFSKPVSRDEESVAIRFNRGSAAGEYKVESFTDRAFNAAVPNVAVAFKLKDMQGKIALTGIDNSYSVVMTMAFHSMLCSGVSVALLPLYTERRFTRAVFRFEPNIIIGYPNMFQDLYDSIRSSDKYTRKDMSFLDLAISVGTGFNTTRRTTFNSFLAQHNCGSEIQEMYGLTECLAVSSVNPQFHARSNSLGIPFPNILMKIVDPKSLMELDVGKEGEICICSPTLLKDIEGNPEQTAKILRKHRDGRIWLHTGDIGHIDENGFFYFDYTEKRLAKIRGVSVSLKAIEDVVKSVYGVEDVCVVDYCDDDGDSVLVAVVVPNDRYLFDNAKLSDLKEAIEHECELVLNEASRPSEIEYRASLPKAGLGVTDYKTLTKEVTDNHLKSAE